MCRRAKEGAQLKQASGNGRAIIVASVAGVAEKESFASLPLPGRRNEMKALSGKAFDRYYQI